MRFSLPAAASGRYERVSPKWPTEAYSKMSPRRREAKSRGILVSLEKFGRPWIERPWCCALSLSSKKRRSRSGSVTPKRRSTAAALVSCCFLLMRGGAYPARRAPSHENGRAHASAAHTSTMSRSAYGSCCHTTATGLERTATVHVRVLDEKTLPAHKN